MGFPHPARPYKEKPGIEGRVVLDELQCDFFCMPVGFVVCFEIVKRTVGVPAWDSGLFEINLIFSFAVTGTAYSHGGIF